MKFMLLRDQVESIVLIDSVAAGVGGSRGKEGGKIENKARKQKQNGK